MSSNGENDGDDTDKSRHQREPVQGDGRRAGVFCSAAYSAGRLSWLDEKRMVVLTPRVSLSKLDPAPARWSASMWATSVGRICFRARTAILFSLDSKGAGSYAAVPNESGWIRAERVDDGRRGA